MAIFSNGETADPQAITKAKVHDLTSRVELVLDIFLSHKEAVLVISVVVSPERGDPLLPVYGEKVVSGGQLRLHDGALPVILVGLRFPPAHLYLWRKLILPL